MKNETIKEKLTQIIFWETEADNYEKQQNAMDAVNQVYQLILEREKEILLSLPTLELEVAPGVMDKSVEWEQVDQRVASINNELDEIRKNERL
jgi:hypothetical protein